jgi:tRNA threonylcarbamoyladenosine biosynthesis protein TsaB
MLVLATDTSGRNGSIALARCSPPNTCEVLDVVDLAGGTFSAQLVPQIAELLAQHGASKMDLDAYAVVSGPGSFTGLRVGLAAIKALGEILGKSIAAVSFLHVVAFASQLKTKAWPAIDAGRKEVYVGEFDGQELRAQRLLTMQEFLQSAAGFPVITADAAVATAGRNAGLSVKEIPRPRADAVARLGWQKIQAGELASPEELEANYIRRSDAEIFSAPK